MSSFHKMSFPYFYIFALLLGLLLRLAPCSNNCSHWHQAAAFYLKISNIPQTGVSPAVSETRWLPFLGKSQVFVHCVFGSDSIKGNELDKGDETSETLELKIQMLAWFHLKLRGSMGNPWGSSSGEPKDPKTWKDSWWRCKHKSCPIRWRTCFSLIHLISVWKNLL